MFNFFKKNSVDYSAKIDAVMAMNVCDSFKGVAIEYVQDNMDLATFKGYFDEYNYGAGVFAEVCNIKRK